jgi:hypothetical protein
MTDDRAKWDGLTDGEQSIPHDSIVMRTPFGADANIHVTIAPLVKACWDLGILTTQSFQGIEEGDTSWQYLAEHEPDYLQFLDDLGMGQNIDAYLQFPTEQDAQAFFHVLSLSGLPEDPNITLMSWEPAPEERDYYKLSLSHSDLLHKISFPAAYIPELTRRFITVANAVANAANNPNPDPVDERASTTTTATL